MRNKGKIVLVAGLAVLALSVVVLVLTQDGQVRISADHGGTVPFWQRWLPALAGLALIRLLPAGRPEPAGPARRTEAWVLLGSAVLFALMLRLLGGGEPAHTLLKIPLLLGVPIVLFRVMRAPKIAGGVRRWTPLVPVVAWILLTPRPGWPDSFDLAATVAALVVGFLVNSLLEEFFYRRWLQTRWEALIGPWPGIVLAALLWSVWHIGIQSVGSLPVDLASAVAGHAVDGLFLGYLWHRYRLMWPILVVHGVMNAGFV